MTCEELESRMAEYWSGTLSLDEQNAVEAHLDACETCRAEAQSLGSLWRDLARLPSPEPGAGLRERFHETLAAYSHGAASGLGRAQLGGPRFPWTWQIAAGVALLAVGVGAGYSFHSIRTANAEVSQLR